MKPATNRRLGKLCTAASTAGHGAEDLAAVITTLEHRAGIREGPADDERH